jgi:hypothetical protein
MIRGSCLRLLGSHTYSYITTRLPSCRYLFCCFKEPSIGPWVIVQNSQSKTKLEPICAKKRTPHCTEVEKFMEIMRRNIQFLAKSHIGDRNRGGIKEVYHLTFSFPKFASHDEKEAAKMKLSSTTRAGAYHKRSTHAHPR